VDTHLQRFSLGLRQDDNASKASDDVRAAADYDRDTAVFIRGAFEAERRGNTPRELIGLVLTKAIPLPFSISLQSRRCGRVVQFSVLLALILSKSLRGHVRILAEVSPRNMNAYS
jgi:hypothetical protein